MTFQIAIKHDMYDGAPMTPPHAHITVDIICPIGDVHKSTSLYHIYCQNCGKSGAARVRIGANEVIACAPRLTDWCIDNMIYETIRAIIVLRRSICEDVARVIMQYRAKM